MSEQNNKEKYFGRPRTQIDLTVVEKLGQLQCTYSECATFLSIPEGTLKRRKDFRTAYKKGAESGKISLRRSQFKLAEKNAAMAIWLGKQYLGQKEQGLSTSDTDQITGIDWIELK